MRNCKAVLGAAVATLAIAIAGCGGGDEESSEAAPLNKAEFISRADKICADGDQEIAAAAQKLGPSPSKAETTQLVTDVALPSVREQRDSIAALSVPEGDEDEIAAIVDGLDEAIAAVEDDPQSVVNGTDSPFTEVGKLARAYGMTDCGNG